MAQLYDYRGDPVESSKLTEELAAGSNLTGIRPVFNPAQTFSLTPEHLAGILLGVDSGNIIQYLTLCEEMEERDLHFHSVIGTRKNSVSMLDAKVEAASEASRDVMICEAVIELTKTPQFTNLLADQMDALVKGFSVCEIMWDRSGREWEPIDYKWRDQRFFKFDFETQSELRLIDAKDMAFGVPLAPYKFIQHRPHIKTGLPIRGGLGRVACVAYMFKGYDVKAWMSFAEVYGMPLRIGKYGEGATPEQKQALLRAVANIGIDAAAIVPDSMTLEIVQASSATQGHALFQGLADWFDRQVSKAVLGQTMTTDDGSSLSQAVVHDSVRGDIRDHDARQLSATLQRDLVKPYVDLNFGPQKRYPQLKLFEEAPEDLKLLSESLPAFIDMGLRVKASAIREKFNLEEPNEGDEILVAKAAPSPFGAPQASAPLGLPPSKKGAPVGDEPQDKAEAMSTLRAALTARVMAGETLTSDQRLLLALCSQAESDSIDKLADNALADHSHVMDPVLEPIIALARASDSFEGMLADLKKMKLDTSGFQRAVALLTFQARGLGDATDKV